ncbi:His/Gly/Thr/Pro-type tRNA ligase C-terminal domain-containing protein, partial [Candidatus Omnitrophota bacterium]
VFELTQEDLGAKDAICAGGRYNNLIKEMGGKNTPAIGFAFGMERLILTVKDICLGASSKKVFIATVEKGLYKEAFSLMKELRGLGISCDMDYENKSLKAQMKKAEKAGAQCVIIFGEEEFCRDKVVLRDMSKRSQEEIDYKDIVSLGKLIGKK